MVLFCWNYRFYFLWNVTPLRTNAGWWYIMLIWYLSLFFLKKIMGFTWGNVKVKLSVSSLAKINFISHLNYDSFFSLSWQRENKLALLGNKSKKFEEWLYIPMWLIANFQGQKSDNNFNKSCDLYISSLTYASKWCH